MQSRLLSLIESISNVAIGFLVAILGQVIVFPWFGMQVRLADNLKIGAIFTVISIGRSYCVRRGFDRLTRGRKGERIDGNTR